ncbi:MAG: tryptophan-rich sensory protein [Ignavibacteriaceae bacterium]
MNKTLILKFLVSIILPLCLGAIAGMFTSQSVPEWYATLNKPSFNPPNWIFGPVWTTLYILMGISFFIIWKQDVSKERNRAILVYLLQLLLNFAWSFIFFYFNLIRFALVEIILLWISIVMMLVVFYKIKPIASYINIPYLLWVTFATVLNASYYFLNRS